MSKRVGTMAPREQVDPRTGAQYDFQYGEAALACSELLRRGVDTCVYCEWHDDYVVVRREAQTTYEFYQANARSTKLGPCHEDGGGGMSATIERAAPWH